MDITTTRRLGHTGLEITVASYGGGSLGNFYRRISNEDANAVLEAAWSAGIRYYDTAPFYGRGRSERRIGAFLEQMPREDFVLSTKVGRLMTPARGKLEEDGIFFDPSPFNSHYDYSYDGVMRSHEASLQRLGLDRVDILYVHDIGKALHGESAKAQLLAFREGGLKALEELRRAGDIKGYGLGVIEVEACLECLDYGDPDVFLLAACFTLLDQSDVRPLLVRCDECEVSLVIGGVFNSGILATGAVEGARYNYAPASEDVLETVRRMENICAGHDVPLAAAALQFPLSQPAVASVLLGVGTVSSLERSVAGLKASIPDAFWDDLVKEGLLDPAFRPKA